MPTGLLFHKTATATTADVFKPYNQIFTLHGAIMIFLVLIPGIPAALGNFVLPIMLGAKDVAFPRLNLWSYYFYVIGALFALASIVLGAVDTGWTFYTPYSTQTSTRGDLRRCRASSSSASARSSPGINFIVTIHKLRPRGHDLVPHAAVLLGPLRHGHHPGPGHARAGASRCCC